MLAKIIPELFLPRHQPFTGTRSDESPDELQHLCDSFYFGFRELMLTFESGFFESGSAPAGVGDKEAPGGDTKTPFVKCAKAPKSAQSGKFTRWDFISELDRTGLNVTLEAPSTDTKRARKPASATKKPKKKSKKALFGRPDTDEENEESAESDASFS